MPTKEAIRRELDFSKNMADILDVMKQLAQSQFTMSKRICTSTFGGLVVSFDRLFEMCTAVPGGHPLIDNNNPVVGVVVTTSDQSFMGSLNSKIAKKAKEAGATGSSAIYFTCGRKGTLKFKFNKDNYVGFPAIKEGPTMQTLATQLTEHIIEQFNQKKIGKLYVISAESNSFSSQVIKANLLLPFNAVIKKREIFKDKKKPGPTSFCSESSAPILAEFVAKMWLQNALFYMFKNNKPAEYSALASQMEGSFDNVKKVIGKLSILYKRARNEKVDASMREIFVSTMVTGGG